MTKPKNIEGFPEAPRMVSVKECAELTGLPYSTLLKMCRNREITFIMSGTKYLINYDKLLEQMNGE